MSDPAVPTCACGTCATCSGAVPRPAVADPVRFRQQAIKARLLARIGSTEIEGRRPLAGLGTRDDDDPTIALLDAFAGSLHILAWNAARLADDGSIRRTEDRDALVDLTRLLGYEPRPAISATTTLAFKVDEFPGAPTTATIPKGTKVASVPGQDEMPQIFETDAELAARLEWNKLLPVLAKAIPQIGATTATITIAGTPTTAKPGDLVLVYLQPQQAAASWLLARIAAITRLADPEPVRTVIDLASPVTLGAPASLQGAAFENQVVILGQRAAPFGATAPDLALMTDEVREAQKASSGGLVVEIVNTAANAAGNAPGNELMEAPLVGSGGDSLPTEWRNFEIKPGGDKVDLDAVYPDAVAGRCILFSSVALATKPTQLGRITSVTELSRVDYGLSGKVSRVGIEGIDLGTSGYGNKVRQTTIYLETERLKLLVLDADVALPAAPTDRLVVQGSLELPVGRRIVLTGEQWSSAPGSGPIVGEVATLKSSGAAAGGGTELVFDRTLGTVFRSTTLGLLANCVAASHGETPASGAELLGSASKTRVAPTFALKRSPLTFVPSTDTRGYSPAIEVRVGDRQYAERPTLFELDTEDRAFTVRPGRDQATVVEFAGRLPTGSFNVSALYRTGGGAAGNLPAGRITTVMTPVLGVNAIGNPVPAEGASDPEAIENLRVAAPQSIRTLDRVVSLADFEAYARTRPGVGKSLATELHVGMRSVVCLTIATTQQTPPAPGSDLVPALRDALAKVAVPGRIVRIEGFTDLKATVTAALAIDPAFRRSDVESAVRQALATRFGRAGRNFGEALHRSAVLAAVQSVPGVVAARLTQFALPGGPAEVDGRLICPAPAMVDGSFVKGGLLSIGASDVAFAEMKP